MPELIRFLRESIIGGELTDIVLENWSYDLTLNRPGSLRASVPLTAPDATDAVLDPYRTAIYAVRGNNVEWGGILQPPSMSVGSASIDVNAIGWLGYFDHRVIRDVVGQPAPGGLMVAKPIDDNTATNVGPLPQGVASKWTLVNDGYNHLVGVVPTVGQAGTYRSHFNLAPPGTLDGDGNLVQTAVPSTGLTLHPIQSVTLTIVATGLGAIINVTPHIRIGSTNYTPGPTPVVPAYGATTLKFTWTTNPATSLPWTPTDIYAFYNGNATAGFITGTAVSFVDVVVNQMTLTVSYGSGFSDFFTQTDQFDIFKSLVTDAQSEAKFGPGYDLGIDVVWDAASGILRDRLEAYRPWLAKNLGEALRQLGALQNGFDYEMQYALNGVTNRIDKQIKLYYPSKGRETNFVFEYDRSPGLTNVIQRGFGDPVNFAWVGDGWGSGQEAARLRSSYEDATKRGVYPPYDSAPSWTTVTEQTTLNELTAATFAHMNTPTRVPVIRVDPDAYPQWGDYALGDVIRFRCTDGIGSTDPDGQRNRITGWKVTSDPVYDLVLADPLPDLGELP